MKYKISKILRDLTIKRNILKLASLVKDSLNISSSESLVFIRNIKVGDEVPSNLFFEGIGDYFEIERDDSEEYANHIINMENNRLERLKYNERLEEAEKWRTSLSEKEEVYLVRLISHYSISMPTG